MIRKWGKETYDAMMKIAQSSDGNKCGVQSLFAIVHQDKNNLNVFFFCFFLA